MARGKRTPFPVDDDRLVSMAILDSGWSIEHAPLGERDIRDLRDLIRRPLLDGAEAEFSSYVQRIFAYAVAAETLWWRLRLERGGSALCASFPSSVRSDRPTKLVTIVREDLRILRDFRDGGAEALSSAGSATLERLLGDANEATRQVVELVMLESGAEPSIVGSIRSGAAVSDHDAVVLGHAIDEALAMVGAFVKPGRAEPALQQMARGLAALYRYVTGELPRRAYRDPFMAENGRSGGELGDFLDLCRHMAVLLNDALPGPLRRSKPADMAKIVRAANDELADGARLSR